MTENVKAKLREQLIKHEGLKLRLYRDPVGLLTIGVGRNLDAIGITRDEALFMLDNDIDQVVLQCTDAFPWFAQGINSVRQRAVADLCFNMGINKLKEFKHTLGDLAEGDFDSAADNLILSKWFRQVGVRGPRIVHMIRTGNDPDEGT